MRGSCHQHCNNDHYKNGSSNYNVLLALYSQKQQTFFIDVPEQRETDRQRVRQKKRERERQEGKRDSDGERRTKEGQKRKANISAMRT